MKIKIESDGTQEGSKVTVDGKEPKNITDINFSCWARSCCCGCNPCQCSFRNVYFSYSTEIVTDKDASMVKRETYFLADKYQMDNMGKDGRYIGKASINGGPEFNLYKIEQIVKKAS